MVLDHPFPPDPRVENEARSLVEAGFGVTILSIAPDTRPKSEKLPSGIEVVRFRLPKEVRNKLRGLSGTLPFLEWLLKWLIPRIHQQRPFDVLHLHDLYLFGGGLKAARKLGIPAVGDLHENWVQALSGYAWSTRFPGKLFVSIPRWKKLERRWLHALDKIVVVVEDAEQRVAALGIEKEKITVVPNTIYLRDFEEYPVDHALADSIRSACTLVYTGGIDLHRGLDTVIRAMPILKQTGETRLVIVGDGRTRGDLEELAGKLGVTDCIEFTGWLPQTKLKSYMAGADICLVPHRKSEHTDATLPHKLFHYMFMKRPVLVTNCEPLVRIVEAEECGVVCKSDDPDSMAQALLGLRDNPELRKQMGENGHRAVMERHNWNATVRPMIQMYHDLTSR